MTKGDTPILTEDQLEIDEVILTPEEKFFLEKKEKIYRIDRMIGIVRDIIKFNEAIQLELQLLTSNDE